MEAVKAQMLAVTLGVCLLQTAAADMRFCGAAPVRAADGSIARSAAEVREFKRQHPCPTTGLPTGACAGWAVDHVIPLVCGGCDMVENMQWLPTTLKSCAGTCKDRWEQLVYCNDNPYRK